MTSAEAHSTRRPVQRLVLAAVAIALLAIAVALLADLSSVQDATLSYLMVFLLIAGDAVIPVFPGETTLNAAATLAAQGELKLLPVIVAGAASSGRGLNRPVHWTAASSASAGRSSSWTSAARSRVGSPAARASLDSRLASASPGSAPGGRPAISSSSA